MYIDHFIL
jgi:ATP-binding cassette subfamily C (CFTR/MRP) protein 1